MPDHLTPDDQPDEALLAHVEHLVASLDVATLCRLTSGDAMWTTADCPEVGLASIALSDGPVGVRGTIWDENNTSACTPSPTALAATWSPELVERVGALCASEARRQRVQLVLAPTVNLHRTPVNGRHFECYSEDPVLSGRIGAAWVRGIQRQGVGACVKHFICNDTETDRTTVDVRVDDRTLNELYLAPFDIVEHTARPWAFMSSYNGVNGHQLSNSPLLDEVIRRRWGSSAAVITDWGAARDTVESAREGVDLCMPGPATPWSEGRLQAAVATGEVDLERVRDKVRHLLLLAARAGRLTLPEGIEVPGADNRETAVDLDDEQVSSLLREVASRAMVLVRNNGVLPLTAPRSVAIVGPNAVRGRHTGGGSASVFPRHVRQPAPSIAAALPGSSVVVLPGVRFNDRTPALESRETVMTFHTADGRELGRQTRATGTFGWVEGFGSVPSSEVASLLWRARYTALTDGVHLVGASGIGEFTLRIDGELVADEVLRPFDDRPVAESLAVPPQLLREVPLVAGQTIELEVGFVPRFDLTQDNPVFTCQVNVGLPWGGDDVELQRAVDAATAAELAIVVVGTNDEVESEGFDRTSLALPGAQDELVERVCAANPNTVVVVNSGAPVLMPWFDQAAAVLLTWFAGQEMGDAIADVLTGATEPGGRLPTTWPRPGAVVQPENIPTDGRLDYSEGLHIGHRAYLRDGIEPLLCFGSGLGYTTWTLGPGTLEAPSGAEPVEVPAQPDTRGQGIATVATDGAQVSNSPGTLGDFAALATVTVPVTNTGGRAGAQVVQAYLRRADSAIERPVLWLAGFVRVEAQPGETVTASIELPRRSVQHWNGSGWAVEPGAFEVLVGTDVEHLVSAGRITA